MKRKFLLPLAAIPLALLLSHAAAAAPLRAGVRLDRGTHIVRLDHPPSLQAAWEEDGGDVHLASLGR